jgi:photosystem II stability/assembly factor-like uncharacterized protein
LAPGTLYAGTGNGVLKSTDGGSSWSEAKTGLPDNVISAIIIDPMAPSTVYAVAKINDVERSYSPDNRFGVITTDQSFGVYRSTNGGLKWAAVSDGLGADPIYSLALDSASSPVLYAGTLRGVFKTTDSGGNWTEQNFGLSAVTVRSFVMDPATPGTIFVAAGESGVFKSTDSGQTWTTLNSGLTVGYVSALLMDPATPTTLYALGTNDPMTHDYSLDRSLGIFKSTDGGKNWSPAKNGLPTEYLTALVIDPATPTTLYAAANGFGIFKSTDGSGSWSSVSNGFSGHSINCLAVDPQTPTNVYAGTYEGFYKSTDGGGNWTEINTELAGSIVETVLIDPEEPTTLYAGAFASGLFKSTDGGLNWSALSTGRPNSSTTALAIHPTRPASVLWVASNDDSADAYSLQARPDLFETANGGRSWSMTRVGLDNMVVYTLAIDPVTPTRLYLGTSNGVFVGTTSGGN